jgi:recombination protein RecA
VVRKEKESLEDILAEFTKKQGIDVGTASEVLSDVVPLSTGHIAIDDITQIGGLPRGRVIELFGKESSGKSTVATTSAGVLQRDIINGDCKGHILYLDFEHTFEEKYARALGVDTDHSSFILAQPNWLEQGEDLAHKLMRPGLARMVIWDSVAVMMPKDNLEADFDQRTGAMNRGRLMKEMLDRLTPLAHEQDTTLVFVNHIGEVIDTSGRRPGHLPPVEESPGGKALKFHASLRLSFKEQRKVTTRGVDPLSGKEISVLTAVETKVKVVKNKVGIGGRETVIRVNFGKGFDNFWSAWEILKARKKIVVTPQGYHFFERVPELIHEDMDTAYKGSERTHLYGKETAYKFADEHPEWRDRCVAVARDLLAKSVANGDVVADISDAEEVEE